MLVDMLWREIFLAEDILNMGSVIILYTVHIMVAVWQPEIVFYQHMFRYPIIMFL